MGIQNSNTFALLCAHIVSDTSFRTHHTLAHTQKSNDLLSYCARVSVGVWVCVSVCMYVRVCVSVGDNFCSRFLYFVVK